MENTPDSSDLGNNQKEYGNILDFVYLTKSPEEFHIEVAIREDGKAVIFHNRPFRIPLAWVEFDMTQSRLDFVSDMGDIKNFGIPVKKEISKNLQNTHQILMILMDDESGLAKEGNYLPVILHQY